MRVLRHQSVSGNHGVSVEKLSRIWQHCDVLGVSLTLDGAKDEGATRRPGRKTESGFTRRRWGGGTEPRLRKVPKGRVRLTGWWGDRSRDREWWGWRGRSGDSVGGANGFSSVDDSRDSQGAGRFERSARGTTGLGGEGNGVDGVMLVTLASANFGTARENFSLDFPRKTRTALDTANRLEL